MKRPRNAQQKTAYVKSGDQGKGWSNRLFARKADAILFGSAGMPGDEAIPFAIGPGASLSLKAWT